MRPPAWIAAFAISASIAAPVASRAATTSIGANLGMAIVFPSDSRSSFTTIAAPGSVGQLAPGFMPGLRVAVTGDSGIHTVTFDPGIYVLESGGENLTQLEIMVAYQAQFTPLRPNSLFANVGFGLIEESAPDVSITNHLVGIGLGVRHRLAHGHGDGRMEIRLDAIGGDTSGFTGSMFSARFGFDLDTK